MSTKLQQIAFIAIVLFAIISNKVENTCKASVPVHHKTSENDHIVSEKTQEKYDHHQTPKDQTLIVRLPSNTLLKYTSYKDVSILHFRIPPDTHTAYFTFKAFEESKSAFQRKCKPRDVSLHLKASSYPVISPENITFPKNFLSPDLRFRTYSLKFLSNEVQEKVTIEGPQIGDWFAVAFLSWTDPNNDRIEQQGLGASCDTLLLAELSVSRFDPVIINNGQVHYGSLTSNSNVENNAKIKWNAKQNNANKNTNLFTSQPTASPSPSPSQMPTTASASEAPQLENNKISSTSTSTTTTSTKAKRASESGLPLNFTTNHTNSTTNNEIIYKFFVPRNIGAALARITTREACMHCPDVGLYIQANAYPQTTHTATETNNGFESNYMHIAVIKPNQTGQVSIEFFVQPDSWHYALLKFVGATELAHMEFLNKLRRTDKNSKITLSSDSIRKQRRMIRQAPKSQKARMQKETEILWYNFTYSLQIDYIELKGMKSKKENHSTVSGNESKNTQQMNNTQTHDIPDTDTTKNPWQPVLFRGIEFYPLLRQTYREFFMFDYDLLPDVNGTVPTVLNLTAGTPAGFAFDIGEVYDIGGTLSFVVSMKHGYKTASDLKVKSTISPPNERGGILAEKLVGHPLDSNLNDNDNDASKKDEKTATRSNQTIIVCMHLGEPGMPTWPDKCRYGRKLLPASAIVNNTDANTSTGLVHVPFPESGQWYVTMGLYCHGAETAARATIIDSVKDFVKKNSYILEGVRAPCACASDAIHYISCSNDSKCLAAMSETETLKVKECLMDSKCTSDYIEMTQRFEIHHKLATEQHFALDNCNSSVVFTVSSSPCVGGRCGRFGRCYHYMSGGFVFSTCVCMKGYRGWDCTEDTQVPSNMSILVASLLLTLSNLLFFPSIYIASRRKYYNEAIIYFFAMFFSIFYHACDSGEDEYSFCLAKIGVLQFCDFYCGLLAIWVTLVAMSHIRAQFVSLLHIVGAILLAFGTELNKQSLWVFLAPALTGICLISASWGLRCHKSRKWFPARKYLTIYMPLGMVLVMIGLVCYAFLQTKQNYHIVHSIWHMLMALSILCLLPSRKSFIPKC